MTSTPDEQTRLADLQAMIARGNHKSSALISTESLKSKYNKEVDRGWMIPLPIPFLLKLKHASVIPLGVAFQKTINDAGDIVDKERLTHDLSFPTPSGFSVNDCSEESILIECVYGQCLRRVLHTIHTLRLQYPGRKIFLSKFDLDAAYRRLHSHPLHAVRAITIIDNLAYLLLRLPFGASAGPALYSTVSEMIFDLCNDLVTDPTWDYRTLHSPHSTKLETPTLTDDSIPFEEAIPLMVDVPVREISFDGYIDDIIAVALDCDDNVRRSQETVPLAVHSIYRPIATNEHLTRDDPLSLRKLSGDGTPSERKTILGWSVCTRSFRVFLPDDKARFWIREISDMLDCNKRIPTKSLERLIGKLNHLGFILPHARYFLNRIRYMFLNSQKHGPQHIGERVRNDLLLWRNYIQHASHIGVSINLIIFGKWTTRLCTDASEIGLGGYKTSTGAAWRWKLPPELQHKFHINTLEFLSSLIGIWLELLTDDKPYKRILCLTDSSFALGWLYKSNFNPVTQQDNDHIARELANLLMSFEASLYSQHIVGKANVIADSLSRDHHIPIKQLTFILNSLYNDQSEAPLKISEELPSAITSFLSSLKPLPTRTMGSHQPPVPSSLGLFFAGDLSWGDVVLRTNSLTASHLRNAYCCFPHSQAVLETMKMVSHKKEYFMGQQFAPPFPTYARPFGRTFGGTRC